MVINIVRSLIGIVCILYVDLDNQLCDKHFIYFSLGYFLRGHTSVLERRILKKIEF